MPSPTTTLPTPDKVLGDVLVQLVVHRDDTRPELRYGGHVPRHDAKVAGGGGQKDQVHRAALVDGRRGNVEVELQLVGHAGVLRLLHRLDEVAGELRLVHRALEGSEFAQELLRVGHGWWEGRRVVGALGPMTLREPKLSRIAGNLETLCPTFLLCSLAFSSWKAAVLELTLRRPAARHTPRAACRNMLVQSRE